MTKLTMTDADVEAMKAPTRSHTASALNNRHAKMFDLLRHCDIEDAAPAKPRKRAAKAVTPRYMDEDAVIAPDQAAAIAVRYLDSDTADEIISRGVSSFKAPNWLEQSSETATARTAEFLNRQAS